MNDPVKPTVTEEAHYCVNNPDVIHTPAECRRIIAGLLEHAPKDREAERAEFEAMYDPMGFNMTRSEGHVLTPEPWCEYLDVYTGYAWSGWLARSGVE